MAGSGASKVEEATLRKLKHPDFWEALSDAMAVGSLGRRRIPSFGRDLPLTGGFVLCSANRTSRHRGVGESCERGVICRPMS
jgi:hypothetical protein